MNKHSKLSLLSGAVAFAIGSLSVSAETHTIYSEDFATYALDTVLTNQSPWWTPNWNGGDVVQGTVSLTGPDGVRAFTRATQVVAGRFYGGGIRGDLRAFEIPANVSADPADITLSFWIKGTSSQSRGPVGVSVISKDAAGANTGAVYYKLPIVPPEWTEFTFSFAEMQDGIPNIEEKGFDFSSPRLQVFFWMRTDWEDGWPIQEAENHTYSVSIAEIRIESIMTGEGGETWGGFPVYENWVDTGDWLGLLFVGNAPWIYSLDLATFLYMPAEPESTGAWAYILR